MNWSRAESTTSRGRALVLAVVATVALAGVGAFAAGASSGTGADGPGDWSPDPGKEVTPDNGTACPPANETTPDNENDDLGYQLVINYSGAWQGTIVTEDMNIPIEDTGNETIDIEADDDENVAATVSKANITDETMSVSLYLDGEFVDGRNPVEPTVDNFDDTDDTSGVSSGTDDSTGGDPAFSNSSDTSSMNDAGTDDDWRTFDEEDENGAFNAESDPSEDDGSNTTATASDDFGDGDGDGGNTTVNDTAAECDADEKENTTITTTSESTNDTTITTQEASVDVETSGSARVVFADQEMMETPPSVVVESATLPDGGFVVIHSMSLMRDGEVEGSVVGVSNKLDAQRGEDINVTLNRNLAESQTLVAVAYRDTNEDGDFTFDGTTGGTDAPYRDDGSAIFDDANVTVPGDESTTIEDSAFEDETTTTATDASAGAQDAGVFTDTATATRTPPPMPTSTEATTDPPATSDEPQPANDAASANAEQSTETNAPGFGIGAAIVAMAGTALVASRRRS